MSSVIEAHGNLSRFRVATAEDQHRVDAGLRVAAVDGFTKNSVVK